MTREETAAAVAEIPGMCEFLGVEYDTRAHFRDGQGRPASLEAAVQDFFKHDRPGWDAMCRDYWGLAPAQSGLLAVAAVVAEIERTGRYSKGEGGGSEHWIDPEGRYRATAY